MNKYIEKLASLVDENIETAKKWKVNAETLHNQKAKESAYKIRDRHYIKAVAYVELLAEVGDISKTAKAELLNDLKKGVIY